MELLPSHSIEARKRISSPEILRGNICLSCH